jgi:hypothetical protein
LPIETTHAFVEPFANGVTGLETKQFARRTVEICDAPLRIRYDDSFLDRVENRFEKTFFLGQAQKIILHLLGADAPEPLD